MTIKVIIFQKAVSLFRLLSSVSHSDPEVLRIVEGTPLLSLLNHSDLGWDTSRLKNFIDTAFRHSGFPEAGDAFGKKMFMFLLFQF